jgi:hypothetical protein
MLDFLQHAPVRHAEATGRMLYPGGAVAELIGAKEATAPINRRPPADRCAERPAPRGRSPRDSAASRAAVRAARADSRPLPRRSRSSICRLLDEQVASRSIACSPSIHIRNGAEGVGRALCRRSTSSFVGPPQGKESARPRNDQIPRAAEQAAAVPSFCADTSSAAPRADGASTATSPAGPRTLPTPSAEAPDPAWPA